MFQLHSLDVTGAKLTKLNSQCPSSQIMSDVKEDCNDDTAQLCLSHITMICILGKIKEWLLANPDCFYHLSGPGIRVSSTKAKQSSVQDIGLDCIIKSGECARASLVSLMWIIVGAQAAKELLGKGTVDNRFLCTSGLWFEHNLDSHRLQRVGLTNQ